MSHASAALHRATPWNRQPVKLFESLTNSERRTMSGASRLIELRRRQQLYVPGDGCYELFVLKTGVVKLSVATPEGREIILSFLRPGDMFGELAIVADGPHDHTAEAHEDTVLWAVRGDVIRKLMRESSQLACELTKLMGRRLQAYRNRVEELLYKGAQARVAHTLLDLAGHHGVPDAQGIVIPLRLSQRDIANLVGLTRETVNFILKDMRQRELIEKQGHSIRLRVPEALRALR